MTKYRCQINDSCNATEDSVEDMAGHVLGKHDVNGFAMKEEIQSWEVDNQADITEFHQSSSNNQEFEWQEVAEHGEKDSQQSIVGKVVNTVKSILN